MAQYPVQDSARLRLGLELGRLKSEGTDLVQNPVKQSAEDAQSRLISQANSITALASTSPAPPEAPVLLNIAAVLNDFASDVGDFITHTDRLVHGDNSATLISGGIRSNAGQVISAIRLNQAYMALDGNPVQDDNDTGFIMDFMGSVMGQGSDLFADISDFLDEIDGFISSGIVALDSNSDYIIDTASQYQSQVNGFINNELSMFQEWIQRQQDFGFGSFFAGAPEEDFVDEFANQLGTQELLDLIFPSN